MTIENINEIDRQILDLLQKDAKKITTTIIAYDYYCKDKVAPSATK
ncbi:MAG: hypothetical protein ACFFG0_08505 [Candidatus Thorarchaeota archaeon]